MLWHVPDEKGVSIVYRTETCQIWLWGDGGPYVCVCPGWVQSRIQICV